MFIPCLLHRPISLGLSWHESCSTSVCQHNHKLHCSVSRKDGIEISTLEEVASMPTIAEEVASMPTIAEEVASMPTIASPRSGHIKTDKKQSTRIDGDEWLERYLRDVRRYSVLSRESERALAKQIMESRTQWQEQLLEHLLHIPLLLAWRSRIYQGTVRLTSLCRQGATSTMTEFQASLRRLHVLRDEMRHIVQEQNVPQPYTVAPLQATMRKFLQGLDWHPEFLQQAWHKFHAAMTRATVAGQCQRAACYVTTLGYSMEALRLLWHDLCRVYSEMEQAKQEMV